MKGDIPFAEKILNKIAKPKKPTMPDPPEFIAAVYCEDSPFPDESGQWVALYLKDEAAIAYAMMESRGKHKYSAWNLTTKERLWP